jgi:hypothetical protein
MPLGARSVAFMSGDVARDASRVLSFADSFQVRYVFWRADEPPPPGLLAVSRRTTLTRKLWRAFDLGSRGPLESRALVAK